MRNFRFDTGFITDFDPNRKLRTYQIFFWEIGSCLATFAHAQMNLYTIKSSAESLSLLRAVPRRNTRGLCSQGTVAQARENR
jgi:hypothetical protein